jgi:hypothetical protein
VSDQWLNNKIKRSSTSSNESAESADARGVQQAAAVSRTNHQPFIPPIMHQLDPRTRSLVLTCTADARGGSPVAPPSGSGDYLDSRRLDSELSGRNEGEACDWTLHPSS